MTNEELKQKVDELLPEFVICYAVKDVNHKPHIFMITEKHISNSKGVYLDPNSAKCGHKGCMLSYEEHTSDKAIFLQLKDNITNDSIQKVAKKIVDELPDKSFDGFAFIDTDEKYRIL